MFLEMIVHLAMVASPSYAAAPLEISRHLLAASLVPNDNEWQKRSNALSHATAKLTLTPEDSAELNAFLRGRAMTWLDITRERAMTGRKYPDQDLRLDRAIRRLGAIGATSPSPLVRETYNSLTQLKDVLDTRWRTRHYVTPENQAAAIEADPAEKFRYQILAEEAEESAEQVKAIATTWRMEERSIRRADELVIRAVKLQNNAELWGELNVLFVKGVLTVNPRNLPDRVDAEAAATWTIRTRPEILSMLRRVRVHAERQNGNYSDVSDAREMIYRKHIEFSQVDQRIALLVALLEHRWILKSCEVLLAPFDPDHPKMKLAKQVGKILAVPAAEIAFKMNLVKPFVHSAKVFMEARNLERVAAAFYNYGPDILAKSPEKGLKIFKTFLKHGKPLTPAEHELAAQAVGLSSDRWAEELAHEEKSVAHLSHAEQAEHMEAFKIGALLENAMKDRGGFPAKKKAAFYTAEQMHAWANGRPLKDALIGRILVELGAVGVQVPSWRAHRQLLTTVDRRVLEMLASNAPSPVIETSLEIDPELLRTILVYQQIFSVRLDRIYRGLSRLNNVPRSPYVDAAMSTLLESEMHATMRDLVNPQSQPKLFVEGDEGIELTKGILTSISWRNNFNAWLFAQEKAWDSGSSAVHEPYHGSEPSWARFGQKMRDKVQRP